MSLLGERLRQAREARGISPLQVEIDMRIRANVVHALEEGDFESLPPEPFLRGMIRSYSNYLGVDPQEMVDLYIADITPAPPPPPPAPPKKSTAAPPPPPSLTEPIKPPAPKPQPPPPITPAESERALPLAPSPAPSAPPPPITPAELERALPLAPSLAASAPPLPFTPAESERALPLAPSPAASAPPLLPPETLAPPEKLEPAQPAGEPTATLPFLAHITRRGIPFPVIILIGVAVILTCIAGTLVVITRVGPAMMSLASGGTATPTRIPATRTPTLQPGAPPTRVPTLAVTAAPFATFPGNPTPTAQIGARRTPEATSGLNLDVDVTQTITIQVGIDGTMAFSGQMQPGASRTWNATNSLYVRVENPLGATLSFNGNPKWFGARNFAERSVIERQWTLNDKGTPISVAPVAPAAVPGAPPVNPSPTLTPFS